MNDAILSSSFSGQPASGQATRMARQSEDGTVSPSTLAELKRAARWLNEFAGSVTSQNGEDGIVAKALSLLPELNHWCVEFGAWDGIHFSNTFDLVDRQNYRVVLIEGSADRYRELLVKYPHQDRAILVNSIVGWSGENGLDRILQQHAVPRDLDFLSIDVDGNDYHIWNAMKEFKPKLVLIEFNPTMPNSMGFVQRADTSFRQGSSPAALVKLARAKGYQLIAATQLNLLFVDGNYFEAFHIPDNSLELMRDEDPSYVWFAYDGTVFPQGGCVLPWHQGLQLSARKLQVLPGMLRGSPSNYSFPQKCAFAALLLLNNPRNGWRKIRSYFERASR